MSSAAIHVVVQECRHAGVHQLGDGELGQGGGDPFRPGPLVAEADVGVHGEAHAGDNPGAVERLLRLRPTAAASRSQSRGPLVASLPS